MVSSGIISLGVISIGGIASLWHNLSRWRRFLWRYFNRWYRFMWHNLNWRSVRCWSYSAISSANAYGLIAISTGYKQFIGSDQYTSGKAVGLIAIGRHAHGSYALSYYDDDAKSTYLFSPKRQDPEAITYLFSPKRQDPEAVTFFTRWLRKFKDAFVNLPQPNHPTLTN